jgi:hypothetical protein
VTWDRPIVRAWHSALCALCDDPIRTDADFIEIGHEWVHVECADQYWVGAGHPFDPEEER